MLRIVAVSAVLLICVSKAEGVTYACQQSLKPALCNTYKSILATTTLPFYPITTACNTAASPTYLVKRECLQIVADFMRAPLSDGCYNALTTTICTTYRTTLLSAEKTGSLTYPIPAKCTSDPISGVIDECDILIEDFKNKQVSDKCYNSLNVGICSTYWTILINAEKAGSLTYAVPGAQCSADPLQGVLDECSNIKEDHNDKELTNECYNALTFTHCNTYKTTMQSYVKAGTLTWTLLAQCNNNNNPLAKVWDECQNLMEDQADQQLENKCLNSLTASNCAASVKTMISLENAGNTFFYPVGSCGTDKNPIGKVIDECEYLIRDFQNAGLTYACEDALTVGICNAYKGIYKTYANTGTTLTYPAPAACKNDYVGAMYDYC